MDEQSWSTLQDNYLGLWPEEAWELEGKERDLMFGPTTGKWQALIRALQRVQTALDSVNLEKDFARSIFDKVEFFQDSYRSFDAFWGKIWSLPHDWDSFVSDEVDEKEYERWLDMNDRFADLCQTDNVRVACIKHLKKAIDNAMGTIWAHRRSNEPEAESEETKEKKELDDELDAYRQRKTRFESEPELQLQPEPELEPEIEPQPVEQSTVEQQLDLEMESEPDAEPEPEPEPEPEQQPEPEVGPQPVEELTDHEELVQQVQSALQRSRVRRETRRAQQTIDTHERTIDDPDTGQSRQ